MADRRARGIVELARSGAWQRIGILGGTFDPIHFGHLACAQFAMEGAGLDGVAFMPAGNPAFKQDKKMASVRDRLEMVRLATYDNPAFVVSDMEAERTGVTFTIDTIRALRALIPPAASLSFIIGTDALLLLDEWKGIEELAALVRFVCVGRPGSELDEATKLRLEGLGVQLELISAPLLDISSTEVRTRLAAGRTVRYLTPLPVCEYLAATGLYERARSGGEG